MTNDRDEKHEGYEEEVEYQFSDEETEYEAEPDVTKAAEPPRQDTREKIIAGLRRYRRMLIGVAVFFVVIFIVYKMVQPASAPPSIDFTQAIPEKTPAPIQAAPKPLVPVATKPTPPTQTATTQPGTTGQAAVPPQPTQPQLPMATAPSQPFQPQAQPATPSQPLSPPQAPITAGPQSLTPPGQLLTTPSQPLPPQAPIATGPSQPLQSPTPLATASPQPEPPAQPQSPMTIAAPSQSLPPSAQSMQPTQSSLLTPPTGITPPQSSMPPPVPGTTPTSPPPLTNLSTISPPPMPGTIPPPDGSNKVVMDKLAVLDAQNAKLMMLIQTQFAQKIAEYEAESRAAKEKLDILNRRLSNLEAGVNRSAPPCPVVPQERIYPLGAALRMPPRSSSQPKLTYVVQAIIPGRAWLKSDAGDTVTVAEGDYLKDYGRIKKIDPYDGVVEIDTGNKIIALSYGSGNES